MVLIAVLGFSCGGPSPEVSKLRKENAALRAEIDSLKNSKEGIIPSVNTEVKEENLPEQTSPDTPNGIRTGRHDFTLQWISWGEPGSVMILPAEQGWYSIKGGQKSRKNEDHISIEGRIRKISAKELLFEGEIISVIASNNGGKPCIKSGKQLFKSTLNRKYWRMQDMINCEGGMLTDYVDIYF